MLGNDASRPLEDSSATDLLHPVEISVQIQVATVLAGDKGERLASTFLSSPGFRGFVSSAVMRLTELESRHAEFTTSGLAMLREFYAAIQALGVAEVGTRNFRQAQRRLSQASASAQELLIAYRLLARDESAHLLLVGDPRRRKERGLTPRST